MKVVVTGGGGFLGGALVRQLLERGDEVVSLARGDYPELRNRGVQTVRADLGAADVDLSALEGADEVHHVAAKAGIWGKRADFFRANVVGTRNVLQACQKYGVPRLVLTSSPSVCFDGSDQRDAGNELPYPTRYLAHYPESKAIAEREVLAANGTAGVATCALRPHLIFGPGDPHLIPRLIDRARAGKLAIVGAGDAQVSMTYVENAAHAHLCASRTLTPDAPHAGRAYFIAQADSVVLWDWINALLESIGLPPVRRRVPLGVAYTAGAIMESVWRLGRLAGEPRMTRFLALQLARSHSYSLEPAQRDFEYAELVSMHVATERLIAETRATSAPA